MTAWHLEAAAVVQPGEWDNRDLLGLAWLCEQAARGCAFDGKFGLSEQLRSDASRLRATAMQEADGEGA